MASFRELADQMEAVTAGRLGPYDRITVTTLLLARAIVAAGEPARQPGLLDRTLDDLRACVAELTKSP